MSEGLLVISLHPGINVTAHNPVRNFLGVWIFLGCRELGSRRRRHLVRHMESFLYGVKVVTCTRMQGTERKEKEREERARRERERKEGERKERERKERERKERERRETGGGGGVKGGE